MSVGAQVLIHEADPLVMVHVSARRFGVLTVSDADALARELHTAIAHAKGHMARRELERKQIPMPWEAVA